MVPLVGIVCFVGGAAMAIFLLGAGEGDTTTQDRDKSE
jgi:hypothetical protein